MNTLRTSALLITLFATVPIRGATAANQFLQDVYGGDGIEVEKLCWANDDLWMLRGAKNSAGLAELGEEKIPHSANEIVWATIQNGVCMLEIRDGKIDPAFMLEQTYTRHRQIVLQFIYAALGQDLDMLKALTTKPANVKFGRAKRPAGGDMDVYQGIVSLLPAVRASLPASDKVSQSVTYRLPLGAKGLTVRLVRKNGAWLVDTDQRVDVPLDFFFK